MTHKKTAVAALIVLCLSSCRPPQPEVNEPMVSTPSPAGTIWRWTAFDGTDPVNVDQPLSYTLELAPDGHYTLRADCNTGSGSYKLEGSKLRLRPGPMSKVACPRGSLADRYVDSLLAVKRYRREGDRLTLELADDGGQMQFEARKPIQLAGSRWLVRGYNNGKQAVVSVAGGTLLHVAFGEDGKLTGSAGCNSFTARYVLDAESITVGPAASSRKSCAKPAGIMQQESAFLAALSTATAAEPDGQRLQLRAADGALVVDLVAAVTGTVNYRVRKALPPDVEVHLKIEDVSRADGPARIIGRHKFSVDGRQVPLPFEVTYDPADVDPRHSYAVRALITIPDGRTLFRSTRSHAVLTRDNPTFGVEVMVEPGQ